MQKRNKKLKQRQNEKTGKLLKKEVKRAKKAKKFRKVPQQVIVGSYGLRSAKRREHMPSMSSEGRRDLR